jgi:hypothetical protein
MSAIKRISGETSHNTANSIKNVQSILCSPAKAKGEMPFA